MAVNTRCDRFKFVFLLSVRHFCHASLAIGILQAAPGRAVITPQHRFTRMLQGSPSSLWEVVRKYL